MRSRPTSSAAAPLVAERLSDRLAALLRGRLEAGGLRPGDRLPTEAELARMHGVSRTVVREAVHQLRSQGLLVARQGSGIYVAEAALHPPLRLDPVAPGSIDDVVQVREVRRALEGETAALAAQRATPAQVAALKRALRALDRSTATGGDGVAEDLAFHRALTDAAGNPHFGRLLEFLERYLAEAMRITRGHEARRPDFMEQVRAEHQAIVDAVAARQPQLARRRAVEHMERGDRRLRAAGLVESAPVPAPRTRRVATATGTDAG